MTWINIRTGKEVEIVNEEMVGNPPIKVLVLDDGSRWQSQLFHRSHRRASNAIVEHTAVSKGGESE